VNDQPEPVDAADMQAALKRAWDDALKVPADPDLIVARPEVVEYARGEIRRQVKLAAVRSPAGLAGLFPGLGTRKR
jgi:hypothetical protein